MNGRRASTWQVVGLSLAWLVLLALLPWWLGLPLLLMLAFASLFWQHRLAVGHALLMRRALRWGLAGLLLAAARALGSDAFAWGAALLGALAGYTLLAGLEAWLDRDLRRASAMSDAPEWPELALAPIGPAAEIVELQLPFWQSPMDGQIDPAHAFPTHRNGFLHFSDGTRISARDIQFSVSERWIVMRETPTRGVVLWRRGAAQPHRLRSWQLAGWHCDEPWFFRNERQMPVTLDVVLNRDHAHA
ncbi:hypothetical protein [Rhodanobacter sp. L36]|uniref:hypothetical protein n=1 Tax=Rhodanobacter sp. L36 TaxID=1747221 RepID=UPI00131E3579|nr:hypothetical protein [Rhodanobacter sp. L36]